MLEISGQDNLCLESQIFSAEYLCLWFLFDFWIWVTTRKLELQLDTTKFQIPDGKPYDSIGTCPHLFLKIWKNIGEVYFQWKFTKINLYKNVWIFHPNQWKIEVNISFHSTKQSDWPLQNKSKSLLLHF